MSIYRGDHIVNKQARVIRRRIGINLGNYSPIGAVCSKFFGKFAIKIPNTNSKITTTHFTRLDQTYHNILGHVTWDRKADTYTPT